MSKQEKIIQTDVLIAGGGPAGCILAALLAEQGIKVVCVDQDSPDLSTAKNFDVRTTAISFGSHIILKKIGIWDTLIKEACPIKDIQIKESGSKVLLNFLAKDADEDSFGWIVENQKLRSSLFKKLKSLKNCSHIAPAKIIDFENSDDGITTHLQNGQTIKSQLVVGADGRKSFTRGFMNVETRGWNYNQRAFVFTISHDKPHHNIAVEDFRSDGPFAILPMNDSKNGQHQSSIVWTQDNRDKSPIDLWSEATLNAAINERLPDFYGRARLNSKIFSYPLTLGHAQSYTSTRMVLVADAAHGIHPIAGQGLNLGLRDVKDLSDILIHAKSSKKDLGDMALLRTYEAIRRPDNMMMVAATDSLNKLFSNDLSSVRAIRKTGLKIIQRLPRVRKFFIRQAMGKQII